MRKFITIFFLLSCFIAFPILTIAQDYESNETYINIAKRNLSLFEKIDSTTEQNKNFDAIKNFEFVHYSSSNKSSFSFNILPLYNLQTGFDSDKKTGVSSSGIGTKINISAFKNKLTFTAIAYQESGSFATFIDSVANKTNVMPYAGYAHKYGDNKYYFWNNSFELCYKPNSIFKLSLANDRNFIGNGYRSLLLSNNTNSYPQLKIDAKIWRFKYKTIFANFYNLDFSDGKFKNFNNKYGAIHSLQWQVVKKLQITFFEAIVFQSRNQKGFGFDVNYLNPIVFYRPVEYSVGSTDNALLGGNLLWDIKPNISIYSQIILDEFFLSRVRERLGWIENKQGAQIGIKSSHKIGKQILNILAEFNYLRPFIYSHRNTIQNYTNYNTPLAHPYGANCYEILGMIKYRPNNKLQINATASYSIIGYDMNGISYGQNINNSYIIRVKYNQLDNGNFVGQGLTTKQALLNINAYYGLNNHNNTCINAGIMFRAIANVNTRLNVFVYPYVGIQTFVFKNGGLF